VIPFWRNRVTLSPLLRGNANALKRIEVLNDPANAAYHAGERVGVSHELNAGLLGELLCKTAQKRSASSEVNSVG
jgi:hypothetical protein